MKKIIFSILFFISLNLFSQSQVIIKKFDWKIYSTEHFDIYYYSQSKPLLKYTAYILEKAYEHHRKLLNPKFKKRIPFFLYASINDMEQNSIVEVGDGVGGLTEPYKDRFMVYNDGSKSWLRDVIFHEFAHEIQFSILIDGWWETPRIIKSIVYPQWMMEGIAEYSTGDMDIAIEDMYVRDAVVDNRRIPLVKLFGFGHLKPHQTTLAYKMGAKAIRFLADEYGKDKVPLMMYYYRDAYDINTVLNKLIGSDIWSFDRKFGEYLELKYFTQIETFNMKDASLYGKQITYQNDDIPDFNTSPVVISNTKIAYITTEKSHPPAIVIKDISGGKEKILDYSYMDIENIPYSRFTKPVRSLNVSNDKRYIVFTAQKNHREYLCIYDLKENKFRKVLFKDFLEARQFSFSPDDENLVFVGMINGLNNIYEVKLKNLLEKDEIKLSDVKKLTDDDNDKFSPYYLSENKIVYGCEKGWFEDLRKEICVIDKETGNTENINPGINVEDLFADKSGTVFFISDSSDVFNLYSININTKDIYRHTNVIGGVFTPYYENGNLYFSYFRHNSINVYKSDMKSVDYTKLNFTDSQNYTEKENKSDEDYNINGQIKDYRFKATTDLFLPALLYSSPGGLFVFTYWQLSDYLGYHTMSFYINNNSAYPYTNIQTTYLFNKYRTKFLWLNTYYYAGNIEDDYGFEYNKKYIKEIFGTIYPFDRYRSLGLYFSYKDDTRKYKDFNLKIYDRTRSLYLSYLDFNLNGLYLTAVYGHRFNAVIQNSGSFFNGNQLYNAFYMDYLKYIPLSRKSTFVNRFFAGFSNGPDTPEFSYGGVNGLRGHMNNSENENKNVVVYNSELRLCLLNTDYYMYYFFPDFYFKAIYFKLFTDNAYGYDSENQLDSFGIKKIKNSVGFGFNLHTFILQNYQLILSFDWSVNTKTGNKVFYFYLGPLF